MNATDQIEQHVKEQQQGRLLDVAKHVLAGLLANSHLRGETADYVVAALSKSEALIKEVESR